MAFIAGALIGGGMSLVSGVLGANAASDAASQQAGAAREAGAISERQYNQTRADNEPWRQAGMGALSQMQDPSFQKDFSMADYEADPGYAFRMAEGQKALERSAAARGNLMGSGTMKSLTRYSQGVASDEYAKAYERFNTNNTNRFNRLASIAGVGQTATNSNATAGANYANSASDAITGAANAGAAGTVGAANAWGNALGTGANTWMAMSMLNKKTGV